MPLTDTKVRALHGRMLKGEKAGKEADGAGSTFRAGSIGGSPIALPESRRLLLLACILTCP